MSPISKRILAIALPAAILVGAVLSTATRGFGLFPAIPGNGESATGVSRLSTYHIPDSLSFCGEKMPLERAEVRQRMEQAFYTELADGQIILDLKRSTRYFPYIEKKLHEMNLPQDLKYLPVVESALRNLVSYRGAAGIWQFTKGTARKYGLVVNYYVDERFDFKTSTVAALKYLSHLHTTFGNWTLAAAAYNMGQNGLENDVRYQMTSDYYDLGLNDQTKRFVFRIVAIKQIMSHYNMYGLELNEHEFYPPPAVKTVDVGGIPDLAVWAKEQGTSYGMLKYLNPWLMRRMLPYGRWTIDLPDSSQPVMFASEIRTGSPGSSEVMTYIVRRGDSLDRIARMYGVSVGKLRALNNLPSRGFLRPGQKLMIPTGGANFAR